MVELTNRRREMAADEADKVPMLHAAPAAPVAWAEFTHPNGRGRAALTAFLLGASLSAVPMMTAAATPFACYFTLLVWFHVSEYLLTAAFRPDTLSFDNFLLNHSSSYQLMVALACAEYWLEWLIFDRIFTPGWKEWGWSSSIGVVLCVVGLAARGIGMATASTNFSHKIEERKRQEHKLITHGIYSFLRHPAYFGFFWWSVGSQLLLVNPISLVAYTGATFYFFYDRIPYEEDLLIRFFGEPYRTYQRRTWIGIPFLAWVLGR